MVFELKAGRAQPEHLDKLNFHASVIDDLLRRPSTTTMVGLGFGDQAQHLEQHATCRVG